MNAKALISIIILVLVLIFGFQNLGPTEIRLLFWSAQVSKAFLVLLSLILGFILGLLAWRRRPREVSGIQVGTEGGKR